MYNITKDLGCQELFYNMGRLGSISMKKSLAKLGEVVVRARARIVKGRAIR